MGLGSLVREKVDERSDERERDLITIETFVWGSLRETRPCLPHERPRLWSGPDRGNDLSPHPVTVLSLRNSRLADP
jgi:hypothetical protein